VRSRRSLFLSAVSLAALTGAAALVVWTYWHHENYMTSGQGCSGLNPDPVQLSKGCWLATDRADLSGMAGSSAPLSNLTDTSSISLEHCVALASNATDLVQCATRCVNSLVGAMSRVDVAGYVYAGLLAVLGICLAAAICQPLESSSEAELYARLNNDNPRDSRPRQGV
jgi:hypothetical protein